MKKWSWIIGAVFFLVAGCGIAEDEKEGNVISEETSSLFVPMEEETIPTIIEKETELKQGEGLCEILEEKEVPLADLYNAVNGIDEEIFCIDETTGVIYFVNFQDGYIYRIKDEEVAMVVALPANHLQAYNGSLYFMIDFYDTYEIEGVKEGDIYCYTPKTGKVEFVYRIRNIEEVDLSTLELKVKETGIHLEYIASEVVDGTMKSKIKWEYLPFDLTEALEDGSKGTEEWWNDYYIGSPNGEDIRLIHKDDWNNQIILLDYKGDYCLVGDKFYYMDNIGIKNGIGNAKICIKNLATKEEEKIDFWPTISQYFREDEFTESEAENFKIIKSFTITHGGEYIWINTNKIGYLFCYDRKTGEITQYSNFSSIDSNVLSNVNKLYTDGKHLYGDAKEDTKENNYTLCRIYTEQDEMSEEMKEELEKRQDFWVEKVYIVKPLIDDPLHTQ